MDQSAVASAAFCRVGDVMKIDLGTVAVVSIPGILKAGRCLLEPSLYGGIHRRVERTSHVGWHVICTIIVGLMLPAAVWPGWWTSWHIAILIREDGAGVDL